MSSAPRIVDHLHTLPTDETDARSRAARRRGPRQDRRSRSAEVRWPLVALAAGLTGILAYAFVPVQAPTPVEGGRWLPPGAPASPSAPSPEASGLPIPEVVVAAPVPEPGSRAAALTPDVAAAPPAAPPSRPLLNPETVLSGAYVVQLASLQDREQALSFFEDLQVLHPDLLGSLSAAITSVDLGDRGVFHRVRFGPFADLDGARSLCAALGSRGLDCLVVEN